MTRVSFFKAAEPDGRWEARDGSGQLIATIGEGVGGSCAVLFAGETVPIMVASLADAFALVEARAAQTP